VKLSHRGKVWFWFKSLRFAVFSEATLNEKIRNLEKAIANLKSASEVRQKKLAGENPGATAPREAFSRLTDLNLFGQALWKLRLETNPGYSQLTLELRPSGWANNSDVGDWQMLTRVRIWLSFHYSATAHGPAEARRVELDYTLATHFNPTEWICLLAQTAPRQNRQGNPGMVGHNILSQQTKTFRQLFAGDKFFVRVPVYKAWQGDLAHLLVSLTNWSALLWNTHWTANLCPSGIRFARDGQAPVGTETPVPCLHTLSLRRDHEPDEGRPQLNDPLIQHEIDRCTHGRPEHKLRNLGLVLAEMICAHPFRIGQSDPSRCAEKWDFETSSWVSVGGGDDEILGMVQGKTRSAEVREAVAYCLTAEDGRKGSEGHTTFLTRYHDRVIKP
jgi:hypothetical protein